MIVCWSPFSIQPKLLTENRHYNLEFAKSYLYYRHFAIVMKRAEMESGKLKMKIFIFDRCFYYGIDDHSDCPSPCSLHSLFRSSFDVAKYQQLNNPNKNLRISKTFLSWFCVQLMQKKLKLVLHGISIQIWYLSNSKSIRRLRGDAWKPSKSRIDCQNSSISLPCHGWTALPNLIVIRCLQGYQVPAFTGHLII